MRRCPTNLPITPEREESFLRALRETGSWDFAAACGSPHLKGPRAGWHAWKDHAARSPEFAVRVQEALAYAQGIAERELRRRALRKGGDSLLLRLLQRRDPSWRDATKIDVTARAEVPEGSLVLTPRDILRLDPSQQRVLVELLNAIRLNREAEAEADGPVP